MVSAVLVYKYKNKSTTIKHIYTQDNEGQMISNDVPDPWWRNNLFCLNLNLYFSFSMYYKYWILVLLVHIISTIGSFYEIRVVKEIVSFYKKVSSMLIRL